MKVELAKKEGDIRACYLVVKQLRDNYDEDNFFETVERLSKYCNFQLAFIREEGEVQAVIGFHIGESLCWGKYVYVDDLVTSNSFRSKGLGSALMKWVESYAEENGCGQIHLDCGVQRFKSHKFYFKNNLALTSHHFVKAIPGKK